VADSLLSTTKVLALDEFFVTDVADAMILHRLFARLWDQGLVLVATSNRAPDRLYEGGLQRNLFLPFIARLKEACVIHDMQSPVDYRRLARHQRGLYFVTPDRDEALYEAFVLAAEGQGPEPATVPVAMGRELQVPQAAGKRSN
jgi:predicted ATPase